MRIKKTRTVSISLIIAIILSITGLLRISVYADFIEEVDLYSIPSQYEPYLTIPDTHLQEYQIDVDSLGFSAQGTPTFSILSKYNSGYTGTGYSSTAVSVSESGLVTPGMAKIYYRADGTGSYQEIDDYVRIVTTPRTGACAVRVTVGTEYRDILFRNNNYGQIVANERLDTFMQTKITPGMSVREIVDATGEFIASMEYGSNSDYIGMLACGCGDCWGSTELCIKICERCGIKSWARIGYRDKYAGSMHSNALVEDIENGIIYELEAGYSVPAPRKFTVKERTSVFAYKELTDNTIEVYQYDAENTEKASIADLIIPSEIDGKTVVTIGDDFIAPIKFQFTLKFNIPDTKPYSVTIPDTVTKIGERAFLDCSTLGVVYLPSALETIGDDAFSGCTDLTTVYYNGTEEQWNNVTIGTGNEALTSTTIHFVETPGPDYPPAQVVSTTLALDDRIGVNFFLTLPDEVIENNGYIVINDQRYDIPSKDSRGRYPFRYYLAAAEQDDLLSITVHLGDGSLYPLLDKDGYDLLCNEFCYRATDYTGEAYSKGASAELIDLLVKMNTYGAYAQLLFDHKADEIGDPDPADYDSVTLSTLEPYAPIITTTPGSGITRTGSNLMLESATTLTHNFMINSGTIDDYVFKVNGKVITPSTTGDITLKQVEGKWRITISHIVAAHMQDVYEVVVTDREGTELIRIDNYSSLSYAYSVVSKVGLEPTNEDDAKLVHVMQTMYLYNRSAVSYFGVE